MYKNNDIVLIETEDINPKNRIDKIKFYLKIIKKKSISKLINDICYCFCKHEWKWITEITTLQRELNGDVMHYERIYRCEKCGYIQKIKLN